MKNSKKVVKALNYLSVIEEILKEQYGLDVYNKRSLNENSPKETLNKKVEYIRNVLQELGEERKVTNARLMKKVKNRVKRLLGVDYESL